MHPITENPVDSNLTNGPAWASLFPAPGAPRPSRGGDDPLTRLLIPSFSILGLVVLVVLAIVVSRQATRRRRLRGAADWNQLYRRPVDPEPAPDDVSGADTRADTPGERDVVRDDDRPDGSR